MPKIYSALSNPSGDLDQLRHEFEDLFNFFNTPGVKKKVDFAFVLNADIHKITSDILEGQEEIRLFHYSGHSAGSGLDLSGEQFSSEHVIRFFNTISSDNSKIQCVLLNGCENAEIVNQLSHVPVVIGTRSRIQDSIARKFTGDFFRSLVGSGSSYRQAFLDAISAQRNIESVVVDQTRGEGGRSRVRQEQLNDYFLVVNNESTAARSFPIRQTHNWTKYLFILLLAIIGIAAYLLREPIRDMFRGYSCGNIYVDENKCNFALGNFYGSGQLEDPGKWIKHRISTVSAREIRESLNPSLVDFEKLESPKTGRNQLPGLCGYDFNVTGGIEQYDDLYRASFLIDPFDSGLDSVFVYEVEALGISDTLNVRLNAENTNQYLLERICLACASKDKLSMAAVQQSIKSFPYNAKTAEAYQSLQLQYADLALSRNDTNAVLASLDEVIKAAPNDMSLSAYEQKMVLYSAKSDITSVHNIQSEYLQALESRTETPAKYELRQPVIQYKIAADAVRLTRADLIKEHKDGVLRDYKSEAESDYKKLDESRYKGRSYQKEIQVLKQPTAASNFSSSNLAVIANPAILHSALLVTAPLIAVGAFKADEGKIKMLLRHLESSGYHLAEKKYTAMSTTISRGATSAVIYYYSAAHEEAAKNLARQISDWTGQDFALKKTTRETTQSHIATKHDLLVYWSP